jgi:hypothetical protein
MAMRQVTYALQFQGGGEEVRPGVLKASSTAQSASLRSTVGPDGVAFALEPGGGEDARFESEVRFGEGTAFDESGTITFGEGNRLHFETIGDGYLAPSAKEGVLHGVIMWRVTSGEGVFTGATGLITSNFYVDASMSVTDDQFGVLWLP